MSSSRNSRAQWDGVTKALHWIIALLILSQLALGWAAVSWPLSPTKFSLFVWHKSMGMLVLGLMIFRLLWRPFHARPPWPASMPPGQRRAALSVQAGLYLLLIALPVSGWVISSASNIPFRMFWLVPLPHIVEPDKALQHNAELLHLTLFWLLVGLVAVHSAGAFKHHLLDRDDVLRGMLPGKLKIGPPAGSEAGQKSVAPENDS